MAILSSPKNDKEISMAILCKLERFAKVNILRRFFARIFTPVEIFAGVSTICDIIFLFLAKNLNIS